MTVHSITMVIGAIISRAELYKYLLESNSEFADDIRQQSISNGNDFTWEEFTTFVCERGCVISLGEYIEKDKSMLAFIDDTYDSMSTYTYLDMYLFRVTHDVCENKSVVVGMPISYQVIRDGNTQQEILTLDVDKILSYITRAKDTLTMAGLTDIKIHHIQDQCSCHQTGSILSGAGSS